MSYGLNKVILESIIFGLVSAIGLGLSDLIAASVTRKIGVLRTALCVHAVSVIATTGYLFFGASLGDLTFAHWGILIGIAVMGSALLIGFYKALQLGPVAIVSPVVSSHVVVVVLLATLVLGERLSEGQVIGLAATLGGVALASINLRQIRSAGPVISTGVLIALATTVGLGVWVYALGALSKQLGWFLPVYASRLLMLGIFGPMSFVRRERPWHGLTRILVLAIVVMGFLETGSLFAFARGSEIGVISIVAAASTTYPVVPIVGGMLIFRERPEPSQLAGLLIVLIGLLVLGLST